MPRDPVQSPPKTRTNPIPAHLAGSFSALQTSWIWPLIILGSGIFLSLAGFFSHHPLYEYLGTVVLGTAALLFWQQHRRLVCELNRHRETEERLITANKESVILSHVITSYSIHYTKLYDLTSSTRLSVS